MLTFVQKTKKNSIKMITVKYLSYKFNTFMYSFNFLCILVTYTSNTCTSYYFSDKELIKCVFNLGSKL